MRRRFTAPDACGFGLNDHVAWCGEGPEGIDRLAVVAFTMAAARGEQMLFVSEDPDPDRLAGLGQLEAFMEQGTLQLATAEDAYRAIFDPAAQRAYFDEVVDSAIAAGRTGVCVVADNSLFAAGSDEEFAAWLAWEATADGMEASRPVTGICYFDVGQVAQDRLADVAAVHPVLSTSFDKPEFQIFVDGDGLRVVGELDVWCADRLRRILTNYPKSVEPVLDLSELDFIDHRALMVLEQLAGERDGLRLRGAKPLVHRLRDLLGPPTPALEIY